MDDEFADVVVDEGAEVAGQDVVPVAVTDGDAVKVAQGARRAGVRETSGDAETVFGCDGWGRERSDVEKYDDCRSRLEFL